MEDRARLDRGQVLAMTLPARDGHLAVFAATRVNASPDALVLWTHAIAELKRSAFVRAIGRFSDPPQPADLETLTLDPRDLDAIRHCRPGACGLKLSAAEIASLTDVAASSGLEMRCRGQFPACWCNVERYRAGVLEDRLTRHTPAIINDFRRRLESGPSSVGLQIPQSTTGHSDDLP